MDYVIRTVPFEAGGLVELAGQKTMYRGKAISAGDRVFVFVNQPRGGARLAFRGRVEAARPDPLPKDAGRAVPRVTVRIGTLEAAKRALDREALRRFNTWGDGRPETEINFKFFRQATDKIGAISDQAGRFLDGCF
jgi:hypothetical protein